MKNWKLKIEMIDLTSLDLTNDFFCFKHVFFKKKRFFFATLRQIGLDSWRDVSESRYYRIQRGVDTTDSYYYFQSTKDSEINSKIFLLLLNSQLQFFYNYLLQAMINQFTSAPWVVLNQIIPEIEQFPR